jgi:hypothetical protein
MIIVVVINSNSASRNDVLAEGAEAAVIIMAVAILRSYGA